jgi:hypothetical protein
MKIGKGISFRGWNLRDAYRFCYHAGDLLEELRQLGTKTYHKVEGDPFWEFFEELYLKMVEVYLSNMDFRCLRCPVCSHVIL